MKRKWLRALFLLMLAGASFGGPMNPKDIEDLLHIMNETKVEFTIPDESDKGDDGNLSSIEIDSYSLENSLKSFQRPRCGHFHGSLVAPKVA